MSHKSCPVFSIFYVTSPALEWGSLKLVTEPCYNRIESASHIYETPLFKRKFPGSPVVKNPPANAGDKASIPGPGRSLMLLSDMPVCHNYWSPHTLQPISATREATTEKSLKGKSSPHTLQLGKDYTQQRKPTTAKTNFHFPVKMLKNI